MKGYILKNRNTGEVFNVLADRREEARRKSTEKKGWKAEDVLLVEERPIRPGEVFREGV